MSNIACRSTYPDRRTGEVRTYLKKSASRYQAKIGLRLTNEQEPGPKWAPSAIVQKSQRFSAEIASTGRPSGQEFADLFRKGVEFLLRRRGCSDRRVSEGVLALAFSRVSVAKSFSTEEMATVVREEVNQSVSERTVPSLGDMRVSPCEAKVQSLRRRLMALPVNQVAALRDYYTGVLSAAAACELYSVDTEEFASIRLSLRVRVGVVQARMELADAA
jgi:hypothetical protein